MRRFSKSVSIIIVTIFSAITTIHCSKNDKPDLPPQDSWHAIQTRSMELDVHTWSFIIGKNVYFGTLHKDIRYFDLDKKEWQGTFNLPSTFTSRWNCNVAVYRDKAYIGGGRSANGEFLKDWWEFDPSSNFPWKQLPDCPVAGADGTAFVWNAVLYVGLNISEGDPTIQNRLYAFNLANMEWTGAYDNLKFYCGTSGFSFLLDNVFYFGAGYNNSIPGSLITKEAAAFPLYGRHSKSIAPFPVELTATMNARSFIFDQKGYVLGKNQDLYEYNPARNRWRTMNKITVGGENGLITYVHQYNNKIFGFTSKGLLYEYKNK